MKKILALLLAALMVFALVACNNEPTDDTGDKKYSGVTLTMWSMWSNGEAQANVIAAAAKAFEEETGAKVDIQWKGRDVKTLLSAALESGENIDIFEDDYTRIGQVYAPYTYDLTEMAKAAKYEEFSYSCFNNQSIAWAGYLNSIVEQPNIGGIFYDKAAFATAGITTVPTTWAEFLDACAKLKAAGIAPLALDSAYADFNVYHQLVRHLGEDTIADLSKNGGWANNEAAVAAGQELVDFVKAGYLVDGAPDQYPASQNKIGLGKAAMIVCGDYVTSEVNNAVGEVDWGFFNYPTVEGNVDASAYAGTNSLAIAKYSKNAQAAFDFILYLVTGTYGQKLVDECNQIPADTRLTEKVLVGSVEALKNTTTPMSWCASIDGNKLQGYKDLSTAIFEGKYDSGADWCAALDALN